MNARRLPPGSWPAWAGLFLLALGLRLAYWWPRLAAGYLVDTDGVSYLVLAQSLLAGQGLSDGLGHASYFYPPGFPAALIPFGLICGDLMAGGIVLSLLSSALFCLLPGYCLHRVARQEPRVPRYAPLLLILLMAVHPLALDLSGRVLAESFFCALVWGAIALCLRGCLEARPGLVGISLWLAAASYLVKPEGMVYWLILTGLGLFHLRGARPRLKTAAAGLAGLLLLAGPFIGWISHQEGRLTLNAKTQAWVAGFDQEGFSNFVKLNYQLNQDGSRVVAGGGAHQKSWPGLGQWAARYAGNLKEMYRALHGLLPFGLFWVMLLGAVFTLARMRIPLRQFTWLALLGPLLLIPVFFVTPRLFLGSLPLLLLPLALFPDFAAWRFPWARPAGWAWRAAVILAFLVSAFWLQKPHPLPRDFVDTLQWFRQTQIPRRVITEGKPQLAYHSGNIHLPLPYTDVAGLSRYMRLNKSGWLVLTRADVEHRPGLKPIWEQQAPGFDLVRKSDLSPRWELRVFRLQAP